MNGTKQLILVLPCLLYNIFQVDSFGSDEKLGKLYKSINQLLLRDEDENMTPLAGDVVYEWWKSIPLNYGMKCQQNTLLDIIQQDNILKQQIKEKGLQLLLEWWLDCPMFKVKENIKKQKKNMEELYANYVAGNLLEDNSNVPAPVIPQRLPRTSSKNSYPGNLVEDNPNVPGPVVPQRRTSSKNSYPYTVNYASDHPDEQYPPSNYPLEDGIYNQEPPPGRSRIVRTRTYYRL